MCVLFSGVMAPLGVYGVARVSAVLAPGVPAIAPVLVGVGVVTAVLGAVLCVLQRNLKRLLAYSTIAHIGLFLIGAADGRTRAWLVYLAGHAGVKAALFLVVGVLLARFGSVDEIDLHGAGRTGAAADRATAALFGVAALALAGLPPFGAGLGKAALEESVPGVLVPVVVGVSVVTGAAVLRAGLRVFLGVGPRPTRRPDPERTSGEGEERETTGRLEKAPTTMLAAAAVLLAQALAVGLVPLIGHVGADAGERLADGAAYRAAVLGTAPTAPPVETVSWHSSAWWPGSRRPPRRWRSRWSSSLSAGSRDGPAGRCGGRCVRWWSPSSACTPGTSATTWPGCSSAPPSSASRSPPRPWGESGCRAMDTARTRQLIKGSCTSCCADSHDPLPSACRVVGPTRGRRSSCRARSAGAPPQPRSALVGVPGPCRTLGNRSCRGHQESWCPRHDHLLGEENPGGPPGGG